MDLLVTSPPYFNLRSYQDGGEHYAGQIGDEATPAEYLDALIAATAEWMRVLKPGGSIFVNLGDKYAADNRGSGGDAKRGAAKWAPAGKAGYAGEGFVRQKSLMMLPQRYAISCIDDLGLILRAEIVWSKPNGLPESVTDRVRRSHEQVFHFVKQPRYYAAVDEIREPLAGEFLSPGVRNPRHGRPGGKMPSEEVRASGTGLMPGSEKRWNGTSGASTGSNALGKLPSSVWSIPTAPLTVPDHLGIDHFAAFPPELVRRIVLGWSPREVCTACREGRRPISERAVVNPNERLALRTVARAAGTGGTAMSTLGRGAGEAGRMITEYACGCPEFSESFPEPETTPGVVLDPFGGTGTTALVASMFGRIGISVDLSADYCRLAQWRVSDPGERARALDVDKPPVQVDGQLGMFDDLQAPAKPSGGLAYAEKRGRNCANCGYRTQYAGPTCDRCGTEKSA